MNYVMSFVFCGFICALAQFVLEKTKWTPGHMNTLLVIIGCVLSGFKIYDKLLLTFHAGASTPIMNFGYLLVSGASEGYNASGFIGLFKGVLTTASAGISVAVVSAFLIALFFKVRD